MSRRGAASVGIASIVSAASGLLILFIAAKTLSTGQNAVFITFWSLLFAMFGLLGGVQHETTRAVRSALRATSEESPPHAPRALPAGLTVGLCLALVLGATAVVWAPALFDEHRAALAAAVCVGVVAFAGHSALAGSLSGLGAWGTYSILVGSEALGRLVLVTTAALLSWGLLGLEVASAVAAGMWLLLVCLSPTVRRAAGARVDVLPRAYSRQVGQAMIAAAASATIVVGFPVILRLTTPSDVFETAAPLMLAISLTRAPLLIPLTSYQGVAITHFLDNRARGLVTLARTSGVIVVVALLGAGLAGAVGPWLMTTLFGDDYAVSSVLLAALTVTAGFLGVLTLTGAAVLALGHHTGYATGWAVASVVTLSALLLPLDLEPRAIVSLAIGPLAGVVVHVGYIAKLSRRSR